MRFLLAFNDIILNLQRAVRDIDNISFIAIIAALSVLLMAIFRFVIKYAFNVSVMRRNVITPLIFSVLVFIIISGLLVLRGQ